MPSVSKCYADCSYQQEEKCTFPTDISISEDFECQEYDAIEDED